MCLNVYFIAIGSGILGHKITERKLWEQKRWRIRQLKKLHKNNDIVEPMQQQLQDEKTQPGDLTNLVSMPFQRKSIKLSNRLTQAYMDTGGT